MSGPVPYEVCIANARAALDKARWRVASDYAAGRLTPEKRELHEQLIARQAALQDQRAAA